MKRSPNAPADAYLDEVRRIVVANLAGQRARVFLFGSRVWGRPGRGSDVDVGILAEQKLSPATLARLRETLEESHIPYQVEVVDLSTVEEGFRRKVLEDGVAWTD